MTKFFITGVSGGLGLELMKQVVASGDFVYGVSRKEMPEDPVLADFREKWIWRACDVTRDNEIRQTIEHQKSIGFLPGREYTPSENGSSNLEGSTQPIAGAMYRELRRRTY